MQWTTPVYVEIKLDAETTSHQADLDPTRDPLFLRGVRPAPDAPAVEIGAAE